MAEIEALLLAHKSRIEQAQQQMKSTTFQAHVANQDQNPISSDQSDSMAPQSFTGFRGGRGGRGRGRGHTAGCNSL